MRLQHSERRLQRRARVRATLQQLVEMIAGAQQRLGQRGARGYRAGPFGGIRRVGRCQALDHAAHLLQQRRRNRQTAEFERRRQALQFGLQREAGAVLVALVPGIQCLLRAQPRGVERRLEAAQAGQRRQPQQRPGRRRCRSLRAHAATR